MKNFNNFNWLRGSSTLRRTGQVSAQSNTIWRHVAMLLCVLTLGFGQMWGTTVTFSATNLNAPSGRTIGSISLSSSNMTYNNGIYASSSAKSFTLTASGGATISQVVITISGTNNRYKTSGITNCTSCVHDGSVFTCTISPASTSVTCTNDGGGVTVTRLDVTYSGGSAPKRIYMKCGDTWCSSTPRFFAHSWGSVENDLELTAVGGCETDVYYVDIPSGNTSVIFTRQASSSTGILWNGSNFWNQSQDITIGDNDLFTCTGWSSSKGTFSGSTYVIPTHTITYNANGGSGSAPTDATAYEYGETVTVLGKSTLTKSGYVFAGWNTEDDGSGTWYDPAETFTMECADVTLYAQWAACIDTKDFAALSDATATRNLPNTQSSLTTNNIKHSLGGDTRYDTSDGYHGLKLRNSGDWIGFGVAAGKVVTITTETVNTSPSVTIDFSSATTLSANEDNAYDADNSNARFFRIKATDGKAVVINKIEITTACTLPELAYGTGTVTKKYGDAAFTNTLTNSHGVTVSYTSSNTDVATVNSNTGEVTIKAAGTTTITASSAQQVVSATTYCADAVSYTLNVGPAVSVGPTESEGNYGYRYSIGETIDLTATATGGSSYTYQWQKYVGSVWTDLANGVDATDGGTFSGVTTARLQISGCTTGNVGSYRCQVTAGGQTNANDGYRVRVYTLYGDYFGGALHDHAITWTGEYTGTVTLSLSAKSTYTFKITDNDGKWYGLGEDNYVIQPVSSLGCGTDKKNQNIRLFTAPAGDYVVTIDITSAQIGDGSEYVGVSIAYPSVTHPNEGYVYLTKYAWRPYLHYWYSDAVVLTDAEGDPQLGEDQYTTICGNDYWCIPVIETYCNFIARDARTSPTNTTGDQHTNSTHPGQNIYNDSGWKWQSIKKTITFDANYGTGTTASVTGICPGSSATLTTNGFTRAGWDFVGWNTDKYGAGASYDDGATVLSVSDDMTLYAQWERTIYLRTENSDWWKDNAKLTIHYWDGSATSNNGDVEMERAESCSDPRVYKATISGGGYNKLLFYRLDPSDDDVWTQTVDLDFNDSYNMYNLTNMNGGTGGHAFGTFSSSYSAPTFTISYDGGDDAEDGSRDDETKTCDVNFTLPSSAVFTRTGYTQTGWATSDGGSQSHALGGTYTTNDDQTFYPYWSVNSYTLTWDLAGGTVTVAGTGAEVDDTGTPNSSVNYGATITKPTVTKTGYNFAGWDETPASTMPAANTTYTATWTANTYDVEFTFSNVSYSSGDDEGEDAATYGTDYTVVVAAADGYSLPTSISVTIGGDDATEDTDYSWDAENGELTIEGESILGDIEITITAVANTYTITLDDNGGSADGEATATYNSDELTILSEPTYGDHSVDGYYTSANCTTKVATDAGALQASITVSEVAWTNSSSQWIKDGTAKFYAHWKCNTPEISCTDNEITISVPSGATVYYTTTTDGTNPVDPTSSSTAYDPSSKPTISADTKIKAIAIQSGCTNSAIASDNLTYSAPSVLTALESETLYYVADMVPSGTVFGDDDVYKDGLSANTKFYLVGSAASSTTMKFNNKEGNRKTINKITFENSAWFGGEASVSEKVPTTKAIKFKLPSAGSLSIYYYDNNTGAGKIKLAYEGDDPCWASENKAAEMKTKTGLSEGIYYLYATAGSTAIYAIQFDACTTLSAEPGTGTVEVTGKTTATLPFTLTSTSNVASVTIKVYEGSTLRKTCEGITAATSGSYDVTGLSAGTTYTYTVTAIGADGYCDGDESDKSDEFTTQYGVTYAAGVTLTSGSVPTDNNDYDEDDVVTVSDNTGDMVYTGYAFRGWTYNGTFYLPEQTFEMPASNATLTAVWDAVSAGSATTYYLGSITITTGALTKGSTGGYKGIFTNTAGTIATSTALKVTKDDGKTLPSEASVYYESNDLTSTELQKSGNWNTGSTSNRYIRGFKFESGTDYELVLGTNIATAITFYGWCGSASRTLTIGGKDFTSSATKNTFEYHEFTKSGDFSGDVVISQDGDFYGILVVECSGGGSSNYKVTFTDGSNVSAPADADRMIALPKDVVGVPSGSLIVEPEEPEAVGYNFEGWYKETGCSNAWNFAEDEVTSDKTLYAKWTPNVRHFLGTESSSMDNEDNYEEGELPNRNSVVYIMAPVEIAANEVEHVGRVIIVTGGNYTPEGGEEMECTGKIDISYDAALIVKTYVKRCADASDLGDITNTEVADIHIGSSAVYPGHGNGALIMVEHDGTNKAAVDFATKSHYAEAYADLINQFVGTPFNDRAPVVNHYYYSWLCKPSYHFLDGVSLRPDGPTWDLMESNEGMEPFVGYNLISYNSYGHVYNMSGTLVESEDQDIALIPKYYNYSSARENLLANSWTAPIKIGAFKTEDFVNVDPVIYIFNAGSPNEIAEAAYGGDPLAWADESNCLAGQYTTIPINLSSFYTNYATIPSMQSFSVLVDVDKDGDASSLHLDYKRLVYDPAVKDIELEPNHAPRRRVAEEVMNEDSNRPEMMKLYINGESGYMDRVWMVVREDFSMDYDAGWEARKLAGMEEAPQMYTIRESGKMCIDAVDDLEGTVIGFHKGAIDNVYTFSFTYDGDGIWYLNDIHAQQSTLIAEGNTYTFTSDTDVETQFVISATPLDAPAVTTGLDEVSNEPKVRKMMINGQLYIIRKGRIYSATGMMVR